MKKAQKIIIYSLGGIVALGAIAAAAYLATPTPTSHYVTVPVNQMNIVETVTGTGQVQPDQEAVLAFDGNGGTIATVNVQAGNNVKQGQILGTLRSDILNANLEAAQAGLQSVEGGAKPADIALYSQKTTDAQTTLDSTIHDAYLKTTDAVQNQIDTLFNNPGSANPTINVYTQTQAQAASINNEYVNVLGFLAAWTNNTTSTTSASTTLSATKVFLTDLAAIATNLNTVSSGLTQAQINADRTAVNTAATEVNGAISEYTNALAGYQEATATLAVEQSGGTLSTIAAQQAAVDAIQAQINHTVITAPFDGIITDSEPKVGEVFAAGTPAFTIISTGVYKVEVYVSETDVAKLAVGDAAHITLDAYGSGTVFPAIVTQIDPAETVTNGVNSYKITLHFTQTDPRIISGMTANVSIDAGYASQVVAVPSSALVTQSSATYVELQNANGSFTKTKVQTGITGINASSTSDTGTYVEVKSGLSASDTIASFGNSARQ